MYTCIYVHGDIRLYEKLVNTTSLSTEITVNKRWHEYEEFLLQFIIVFMSHKYVITVIVMFYGNDLYDPLDCTVLMLTNTSPTNCEQL